jgi:hypothetical protein
MSTGRASARADVITVPFKKCRREAFEPESNVGLRMSAKRFIWPEYSLSRQFGFHVLGFRVGGNQSRETQCFSQKKREVLTEHLPEVNGRN